MAQLNIRIEDDLRDWLDALARARDQSVSEAVRDLISQAVGRDRADRHREDTPVSLSALDRCSMILQHRVLAALARAADDSESGDEHGEVARHEQMIEILERGFSAEYYRLFENVRAEMTPRECGLVHDILEMFMWTERSVARLPDEQRALLGDDLTDRLKFSGFDFNNTPEARLASYARYLTSHGQWEEMAPHFDARHEQGNSHWPTLARYQRMLSIWKPIWDARTGSEHVRKPGNYFLDVDELREIASAGYRS
jgi:uncharacterized protein YfbU (UPF0304 family)